MAQITADGPGQELSTQSPRAPGSSPLGWWMGEREQETAHLFHSISAWRGWISVLLTFFWPELGDRATSAAGVLGHVDQLSVQEQKKTWRCG